MSEKKTTLPSLKNQDWKTINAESEEISELLTRISTNNITEFNKRIYVGGKLVCDSIGVPQEIRLETEIRNLW